MFLLRKFLYWVLVRVYPEEFNALLQIAKFLSEKFFSLLCWFFVGCKILDLFF